VTPFEWTRRRLHHVAASLFVSHAVELLKWQTPAQRFSEAVSFLTMGRHKKFATQSYCEISR
jgi:hypothetical protein